MKTAKIPVYGNITVHGNIALSVYKIDYTLRRFNTIHLFSTYLWYSYYKEKYNIQTFSDFYNNVLSAFLTKL